MKLQRATPSVSWRRPRSARSEFSAKVASDSAKAFKERLDAMMAGVQKDVTDAAAVLKTRKGNIKKVLEAIKKTKEEVATNLEAVAEKAEDEELCKDLKAEKRKPWSKLDASLVEMEEEAKNQHDVVIPKFEKKMESLKKKSEEDKKAIDATAKEIDAAAGKYGKAVKTAVDEINKAEKAEMKRFDEEMAAAKAAGAQVVKGVELTGNQVRGNKEVMGMEVKMVAGERRRR